MGGHHRAYASLDGRTERFQLDLVETLAVVVHRGQSQVGVGIGIAMAGEVLQSSDHAAILVATYSGDP